MINYNFIRVWRETTPHTHAIPGRESIRIISVWTDTLIESEKTPVNHGRLDDPPKHTGRQNSRSLTCYGYVVSMDSCGRPAMNTAMDMSYPWAPVANHHEHCYGYLISTGSCGKSAMNTVLQKIRGFFPVTINSV